MDAEDIKALVQEAVKKEIGALREATKKETDALKEEIKNLKLENQKLKDTVTTLDRGLDELDQYSRKTSLILGGAFPEGEEWESPSTTRDTAMQVIKEKLKVNLKGGIAACHRLRNKKRVIIKFQDQNDRDAVYQAKFNQETQGSDKITVHENLTQKRSEMVNSLESLRKDGVIANYHTKNGKIMARSSPHKKYVPIQPWYTHDDIVAATDKAPTKKTQHYRNSNLNKSQTLKDIPQGHVASHTANLEEYVVGMARNTRQAKKTSSETQVKQVA